MSPIVPARDAHLVCDGCGKEIKSGASTYAGRVMTFLRIETDGEPLFRGEPLRRWFHLYCLPNPPEAPIDQP